MFKNKSFQALSYLELFQIYELRSRVFVVEQNCAYQDVDAIDLNALHVMHYEDTRLIAYARIIAPSEIDPYPKIGRVVVHPQHRSKEKGKDLMKYCVHQSLQCFGNKDIVISAQAYLLKFYTDLGFVEEGELYLEDTIPHKKMRYSFPQS
jgi:ElaA protein